MNPISHWEGLQPSIVWLYKDRNYGLVKALRSGNYPQGRGYLKRNDKFCCMGVACDLTAVKLGLKFDPDSEITRYNGESSYVPLDVAIYYGWAESNPYLILASGDVWKASHVNDELALPFNEIADAFQRTYVNVEV